jgi:hypothetical protein
MIMHFPDKQQAGYTVDYFTLFLIGVIVKFYSNEIDEIRYCPDDVSICFGLKKPLNSSIH